MKLVMVYGMWIREDLAAGRRKSMERWMETKNKIAQASENEIKLANDPTDPTEIACLRHKNHIRTMENMGLGTPHRVRRTTIPA